MRNLIIAVLIALFLPVAANAGNWATRKLSPGGYVGYTWTNTNDDTVAPHIDARSCGSLVFGYEDDILGAGVTGAVSAETCPFSNSNVALCTQIANYTADTLGDVQSIRPGFLYLDVTATGAGEEARLTVFCGREVGP